MALSCTSYWLCIVSTHHLSTMYPEFYSSKNPCFLSFFNIFATTKNVLTKRLHNIHRKLIKAGILMTVGNGNFPFWRCCINLGLLFVAEMSCGDVGHDLVQFCTLKMVYIAKYLDMSVKLFNFRACTHLAALNKILHTLVKVVKTLLKWTAAATAFFTVS